MNQSLEAQRQAKYRRNRNEREERMKAALTAIVAKLADRTTPIASELRAMAEAGLE